ncbi:uncharacterized protein LOC124265679 [Haliotis rubra]|uniref:uncharacterized protein LOC124265679 n=1 Tax=Haliotis rubra TaxID=36100 RepID=UPI001EE57536|nr:uncharacterized protein LOC124265679 [Haliotis rubra]
MSEVSSGSINIARGKDASQSTTSTGGTADRATDGITSGRFSDGSCTSTKFTNNPWFVLDLGETYQIQNVVIYSRTDECCVSRLSNFSVEVFGGANCKGGPGHGLSQCAYHENVADSVTSISCNGIGRFIRIKIHQTSTLHLCEVEVYTVTTDPCEVETPAAVWPVQPKGLVIIDAPTSTVWEDFSTQIALVIPSMTSRSEEADSTDSSQVMTSTDETVYATDNHLSSVLLTSASGFPIQSSHVSVYEGTVTTSLATTSSTNPPSSSVKPYTGVTTISSISGARTVSEQCLCRCKTPHP